MVIKIGEIKTLKEGIECRNILAEKLEIEKTEIIEERGWKPPLMVTDLTSQLENDIKKAKAEADSANKFHLYYDYSQAMNKVIKLQKTLDLIREAMV